MERPKRDAEIMSSAYGRCWRIGSRVWTCIRATSSLRRPLLARNPGRRTSVRRAGSCAWHARSGDRNWRAPSRRCARGDRELPRGRNRWHFWLTSWASALRAPPAAGRFAPNSAILQRGYTATREQPRPRPPRSSSRHARATRSSTTAIRAVRAVRAASAATAPAPLTDIAHQVIEDAVRLLQWARKWHELGDPEFKCYMPGVPRAT